MPRKTTKKKTSEPKAKPAPKGGHQPVAVEAPVAAPPKPADAQASAEPSAASLARRKRALIDELRSEHTSVSRAVELHKIIDTELANVPILSHQELSRLAD